MIILSFTFCSCTIAFEGGNRSFTTGVGGSRQTLITKKSDYQILAASDIEYRATGVSLSWTRARKGIAFGPYVKERNIKIYEIINHQSDFDPWQNAPSSNQFIWPFFVLIPPIPKNSKQPIEIDETENVGIHIGTIKSQIHFSGGYYSCQILQGRENDSEAAFSILTKSPWILLIPYEKDYKLCSLNQ